MPVRIKPRAAVTRLRALKLPRGIMVGSFALASLVWVTLGCGGSTSTGLPEPRTPLAAESTTALPRSGILRFEALTVHIVKWSELTEPPKTAGFGTSPIDPGWKRVVIDAVAMNTSGGIVDTGVLDDDQHKLRFLSENFAYDADVVGCACANSPTVQKLLPGFGLRISIVGDVPQNRPTYVLELSTGGQVEKGEVSEVPPLVPSTIHDETEAWVIPSLASINYKRTYVGENTFYKWEAIELQVTNDYGQNVDMNFRAIMYSPDGEQHFLEAQGGGSFASGSISPGMTKTVPILYFIDKKQPPPDLSGAVVALVATDGSASRPLGGWAWRLPTGLGSFLVGRSCSEGSFSETWESADFRPAASLWVNLVVNASGFLIDNDGSTFIEDDGGRRYLPKAWGDSQGERMLGSPGVLTIAAPPVRIWIEFPAPPTGTRLIGFKDGSCEMSGLNIQL